VRPITLYFNHPIHLAEICSLEVICAPRNGSAVVVNRFRIPTFAKVEDPARSWPGGRGMPIAAASFASGGFEPASSS